MTVKLYHGDSLQVLGRFEAESVQCVVTSPPYWGLRDYGVDGQFGLEPTPEEHVERMVGVFREVRRVLRGDGTLWLNYGDCYASSPASGGPGQQEGGQHQETPRRSYRRPSGLKPKDLVGMPWRVAFGLQADGWYLRSDIIWAKPNPMPESVTDRPTKSHEHVFLLTKSAKYYYDADAVREPHADWREGHNSSVQVDSYQDRDGAEKGTHKWNPKTNNYNALGRNLRDVWTISTHALPEAHFATFPPKLVEPCIKAGCPGDGTVLDPFGGAGTVGLVADRLGRDAILIELNEEYVHMAARRIRDDLPMFAKVEVITA